MMRILMVGAGATGGYFGGRLAEAGRDVTFLLRDRRAAQIRSEGLRLTSPHGDAVLHPKVITAQELRAAPAVYDLILLSVKAYSLQGAMDDIAPAVGPETLVAPILNGMRHLDVLAERFGKDRLLAGSVRIVADLTEDGTVEQRTPLGDLTVGEAIQAPLGERFTHAVLDECIAVSTANGHPAEPAKEAEMRAHFSDAASPITSSMFRDLQRNLPVEADHILGDLIARAGQVPVPLITAAYVRLKVYEAARNAAAA